MNFSNFLLYLLLGIALLIADFCAYVNYKPYYGIAEVSLMVLALIVGGFLLYQAFRESTKR